MDKIRYCRKCGSSNREVKFETYDEGNICSECRKIQKKEAYLRRKILKKNDCNEEEHYKPIKLNAIDKAAIECEIRGITYAQLQAEEMSSKREKVSGVL